MRTSPRAALWILVYGVVVDDGIVIGQYTTPPPPQVSRFLNNVKVRVLSAMPSAPMEWNAIALDLLPRHASASWLGAVEGFLASLLRRRLKIVRSLTDLHTAKSTAIYSSTLLSAVSYAGGSNRDYVPLLGRARVISTLLDRCCLLIERVRNPLLCNRILSIA